MSGPRHSRMIARRREKPPWRRLHRFCFPSLQSDRIDDEGCGRNARMMRKRSRFCAPHCEALRAA